MKEIEVKAKITNKESIIAKFEELGCKFGDSAFQQDEIFVPQNVNTLPTEVGTPVLRIRESKGKFIFTLKIRLGDELDKSESETGVVDPVAMREIILALGFKSIATVKKTRVKSRYQNWEICVDEVEGLGTFVELEELSEAGDSEQIQKNLFEFLKTLGVKDEDRVYQGYDVLLYNKKSLRDLV